MNQPILPESLIFCTTVILNMNGNLYYILIYTSLSLLHYGTSYTRRWALICLWCSSSQTLIQPMLTWSLVNVAEIERLTCYYILVYLTQMKRGGDFIFYTICGYWGIQLNNGIWWLFVMSNLIPNMTPKLQSGTVNILKVWLCYWCNYNYARELKYE